MTGNRLDDQLDVKGLLCPLPVLKARKRLQSMASGAILHVTATDPMAAIDMPHFCHEQGYELLEQATRDGCLYFRIRRK
jgi:tRNA 2-thiouridine synthesizing protein A